MDYEVKADVLEASFGAIEASGVADEVAALRGEVARLGRVADEAARAARRPAIGGSGAKSVAERDPAMGAYLRKGVTTGLEIKSFGETSNSGADGGYAVPLQIDAIVQATLRDISPIRKIANVVQVGTSNYRRLITLNNIASGWVAENDASQQAATSTIKFGTIAPPMGELYANPSATQAMLDDSFFDLESWLAQEIAREFARAEGAAFVSGSGVNRPLGFLASPATSAGDSARPIGTLQYLATGVAGAFPTQTTTVFPQDTIINLIHSLRPAYRQNASFVMNTQTLSVIRRMKDNYGGFSWTPSMVPGQPDMLFGYPVIDCEDMPVIAPGSFSIAFGDFNAGYIIADRVDTRILRDPYTNKPFVNFYATKRVSGCVANSEAIKLLKFDVS
jgi:HK97 family phage major capsid protein